MGRKSKLTEQQWDEVQNRILEGESMRSLAKEFGVSESSIRAKKSTRVEKIKKVANQVIEAECAVKNLDLNAQLAVNEYASKLRSISSNLMDSALNGSIVSSRLSRIAARKASEINEADPMESQEELQAISALNKLGNDAAAIGLNLVKANNELINKDSGDKDLTPWGAISG